MKTNFLKTYYFAALLSFFVISLKGYTTNIDSLTTVLKNQHGEKRAETLILLGKAYQKTNRNKSNAVFKEACLLIPTNDFKKKADLNYQIAYNYLRLNVNDSASKYFENALAAYTLANDTLNIMKSSTMFGFAAQQMGEFGKSAELFRNGIDLFPSYWQHHQGEKKISKKHLATMMSNYGISLNRLGQYDSALYYATSSHKIYVEIGSSSKQIGKTLVNIGIVYLSANRNREAIKYFEDANGLFTPLKDSFNISKCYNNIGLAYKQMGDTILAINNYEKSLEICRMANIEKGIATSYNNLASLYAGMGDTKKAEDYFQKVLVTGKSTADKQLISNALENLSKLYLKSNDIEKALNYAKQAERVILETNDLKILKGNRLQLSSIYEELGDYKQSLQNYKLYAELHDSLFNADNTERFNRLQTEFETEKKEQQIQLLEAERENQRLENKFLKSRQTILIIVIGMILILIIIAGFMVLFKRKKDRLILLQKELVHKKEKELAQSELEKSKLREEELKQSVLYKSKQLSMHALQMMQKTTMLQEIFSEIKTLTKKATDDDKQKFSQITRKITQNLRSQKDWDVFKLYFEDVNRNFYKKLKDINPDLTTNDHRLCALIKLNMTPKEMASVLNVAPNSIKSSRYRLKKKLGLDVEADLEEFIRGLT